MTQPSPGEPPPDLPPPEDSTLALANDGAFPPLPPPPPGVSATDYALILCLLKFLNPKLPFPGYSFTIPPFPIKFPKLPRLPFATNCFVSAIVGGLVAGNPLNPTHGIAPGGGRPILQQADPDLVPGA